MKISTLGEKKNNELTAPIEAKYALPDLDVPKQQVVTPQQPVVQKVEVPTATPAPTPQPTQVQVAAVETQPTPQRVEQSAPQPTVQPAPQPVAQPIAQPAPQPAAQPAPQPTPVPQPVVSVGSGRSQLKGSSLLGGSLSDLIQEVSNPVDAESSAVQIVIDKDSEAKMLKAKAEIVKKMCEERPRFVSAFENIEFEGNMVKMAVPSDALKEELIAQRWEILTGIAAMAGVKGSLDMKIEIKDIDFKLKPIKLEDREAHIQKVTPEYDYMCKVLELMTE